jgi:hypothetical protein
LAALGDARGVSKPRRKEPGNTVSGTHEREHVSLDTEEDQVLVR